MANPPVDPRGPIAIAEAEWQRAQRSHAEIRADEAEQDQRTQQLRALRLLKEAQDRDARAKTR